MNKFAQLLNQLYFTYSHLDKMTLLHHYFKTTEDPERGYALAVIANTLDFPTFKRATIRELLVGVVDPVLFDFSYDYVGGFIRYPCLNLARITPRKGAAFFSRTYYHRTSTHA